ncbi:transcriptional regulator [Ligilactobacillus salitolerans]|uniref:Transcriptional regulator n=1 Tax=Ligilactobacillus salitolerans TaxID=1808352 RepID=A0A401IRB1_9LACO|nr:BglG family transcription antiterminator [Ligilactobacillus salitolerans]GBG94073.1 transcriptional regulator [Ligilactobacillus salitolerans]
MRKINTDELQIIEEIIKDEVVHYADLSRVTGKSRKTIAKYLDHISDFVVRFQVQLVRKRNVGIYFKGNIDRLVKEFYQFNDGQGVDPSNARLIKLLSQLLSEAKEKPAQEFCEELFVSRGTLENDLKQLKPILKKNGAKLVSNHFGIKIEASERVKRRLISELLNMYWGKSIFLQEKHEKPQIPSNLPKDIAELLDQSIFDDVSAVLNKFQKEIDFYLNDYEYQSLCVHLVIAIKRIKRHEILKSNETQKDLEMETRKLVALLEKKFAMVLPDDEKSYIDIHILAAKEGQEGSASKVDRIKNSTQNDLYDFLAGNIRETDDFLLENLTLHLIPALKRLSLGLKLSNPYTNEIKRYFPYAYNEAADLGIKIYQQFDVKLNEDELAYVTLHLQAFRERSSTKLQAVIVCSTGMGTARLIEQRLKNNFADLLEIRRVISLQELKRLPITEDLVISTINISNLEAPVIVVPPFLDQNSISKISRKIDQLHGEHSNRSEFMKLIDPRVVMIDNKPRSQKEAIGKTASLLVMNGYAREGIGAAACAREKLASTQIDQVAVPHAPLSFVIHPCIGIYINRQGIEWGEGQVNLIFFLAMNQEIKAKVDEIYRYFNEILEDKELLKQLIACKNSSEVISRLEGERNV